MPGSVLHAMPPGRGGVCVPILQVENLSHGEKRFAWGLMAKMCLLHPRMALVSYSLMHFALSQFVFVSPCPDFASSPGPSYSSLGLEWHWAHSRCSTNIYKGWKAVFCEALGTRVGNSRSNSLREAGTGERSLGKGNQHRHQARLLVTRSHGTSDTRPSPSGVIGTQRENADAFLGHF